MFDLIHFSKWNTEIGFFGGSHPLEELAACSLAAVGALGLAGRVVLFCLSPAWLYPGKYHKGPMPLSARWQVAYTTLGRFLVLFLTAQSPVWAWTKTTQLLGAPEAGACTSLVLYCAVYLPQKEMWSRRMHGGNGIMELGTFHPWCPFGGGSSACMMAVLSSPTVLPCVVIPWVPHVWRDCCTMSAECGRDLWPWPGGLGMRSSCVDAQMPWVFLLPFTMERHLPGRCWAGDLPALTVIFGCWISGTGLEWFGSNSGHILFISLQGCFEKHPVLWLAFWIFTLKTVLLGWSLNLCN